MHDIDLCRASIALAIVSTVALKNWSYAVYAAQAFMILMVLAKWAKSRHGKNTGIGWYAFALGFFAFWCLVSSFWSISPERALSASVGVVQFILLGFFIALYISMEDDSRFVIDCLAWSGVALLVVLLCVTPVSSWFDAAQATTNVATDQNRIGGSVGYHPNALGHLCAVCAVLWFYKYLSADKNKRNLLPIAAFLIVILFTKSRLSLVIMVVGLMSCWLISTKGVAKKVVAVVTILFCTVVGVWAMFSIPAVYDLIGFRFAGMFGLDASVDASTTTREEMIQIALALFSKNPITGVGFANYAVYYFYDYSGWAITYAHSNYAELLADLGLPGVISYYAIPIWTLIALITTVKYSADRNMHVLYISLLAVLLVADYSSISYTNDFVQLFWASAFAFAVNRKKELKKQVELRESIS